MVIYEFKLPDIGEGVTEGEIVKWLVAPGEMVREDQPMVEVMTDKATVTITAPKAGKILETRGKEGGVVPVHSVLVVFDLGGDAPSAPLSAVSATHKASETAPQAPLRVPQFAQQMASSSGPAATAVGDIKETLPGMNLDAPLGPAPGAASHPTPPPPAPRVNGTGLSAYFNEKPLATPATRKLARELGVDLHSVAPTGPSGRVTSEDVRGHREPLPLPPPPPSLAVPWSRPPSAPLRDESEDDVVELPPPSVRVPLPFGALMEQPLPLPPLSSAFSSSTSFHGRAPTKITSPASGESRLEERIPLRGMRKRMFEGMARSVHTAAHFTFVEECDVGPLKELRARLRPAAEKEGVKLTFLPFFVKAAVAALKKHPMLNSAFDEETQEIVKRRYYHLGIASATPQGLIVPVVRDADRKSLLDVARDIARLSEDTKTGHVRPADLGGSTFTITSLGQQGGLFATPILNFPEVAILGIHQMKQKPVVRDGQIVIGDVALLSLSFDHRIIDGAAGAAFAYEIIGYLQEPDRLFLEMA